MMLQSAQGKPQVISKPTTAREKMWVALSTHADLEKQLGPVPISTLHQALSSKAHITDEEARRLVDQLLGEGIFYLAKGGVLKRTA